MLRNIISRSSRQVNLSGQNLMADATTRARSMSSTSRDAAHLAPPVATAPTAPAGATTPPHTASTLRAPAIDRYAGVRTETITTERPPWYFQWAREWKRPSPNASGVERACV